MISLTTLLLISAVLYVVGICIILIIHIEYNNMYTKAEIISNFVVIDEVTIGDVVFNRRNGKPGWICSHGHIYTNEEVLERINARNDVHVYQSIHTRRTHDTQNEGACTSGNWRENN